MSSEDIDRPKFVKVVYFDEESAADYVEMTTGGFLDEIYEEIKATEKEGNAQAEASAGVKKSSLWSNLFGFGAAASVEGSISASGKRLMNKKISNTVLTDYLEKFGPEGGVEELSGGWVVYAQKDSMTYMKMFAPYTNLLQSEGMPINIAAFDDVLSKAKGYYELVASKEEQKCVFRFNEQAFRNNYGLTDLTKMELVYHGICVGDIRISELGMDSEITSGPREFSLDANRLEDAERGLVSNDEDRVKVYDIMFAGIPLK